MIKAEVTTEYTGDFQLVLGVDDHLLNLVGDHTIKTGKIWEQPFLEWFGRRLQRHREEDVFIVDIGANIGTFSTFAMRVLPKATIWAFEPVESLVKVAAANLRAAGEAMGHDRWQVWPIAIGNTTGTTMLREVTQNLGQTHVMTEAPPLYQSRTIEVPITRFDDIDVAIPYNEACYVKIDVEGFEPFVIHGMPKFIMEHRPVFLLENNCIADAEICFRLLRELGLGYVMTHMMRTEQDGENWMCVYEPKR